MKGRGGGGAQKRRGAPQRLDGRRVVAGHQRGAVGQDGVRERHAARGGVVVQLDHGHLVAQVGGAPVVVDRPVLRHRDGHGAGRALRCPHPSRPSETERGRAGGWTLPTAVLRRTINYISGFLRFGSKTLTEVQATTRRHGHRE